jgi:hypothetical protein
MQKRDKIRILADILQFILLPGACTTWHAYIVAPEEFGVRIDRRERVAHIVGVENAVQPITDILADFTSRPWTITKARFANPDQDPYQTQGWR